ncbi:MAG: hypothetical protein KGJ60_03225 [Verrucomicrobiota bacterium]|nr:hypothetical protein [Verrucomicrobiota bacterium]
MKETNWLERPWRSWRPRRPSARLKHRLFAARRSGAAGPSPAWLLGWLAPAAACLLLISLALKADNGLAGSGALRPMTLATVLSNESYVAYAASGLQSALNRPAQVSFDWTNCGVSSSNNRFVPLTY